VFPQTITVVSADVPGFTVGNHIKIDLEILKITAINGNFLSVDRGQLNTIAAGHNADALSGIFTQSLLSSIF